MTRSVGSTRLGISVLALLLVGSSALLGASRSTATGTRGVVATGSVTCTKLWGTITYHPAERHDGTLPERQEFVIHAGSCTTKGSNVKRVSGGTVTAWLGRATNNCTDLLFSEPITGTGSWTPRTIRRTTASFTGYSFVTTSGRPIGVRIPNVGGHVTVTGSFAGRDHGARTVASGVLNETPLAFEAACRSAAGLTSQRIVSGRVTFS